jgi:hypothetical protein
LQTREINSDIFFLVLLNPAYNLCVSLLNHKTLNLKQMMKGFGMNTSSVPVPPTPPGAGAVFMELLSHPVMSRPYMLPFRSLLDLYVGTQTQELTQRSTVHNVYVSAGGYEATIVGCQSYGMR